VARKLKIAEQYSLKQNPKDSRGQIAVWLVGKNRWAWRSPVDVREMLGMGQALLEAPAGSPPAVKPTPENPYPDGVEEGSEYSEDDGDGDGEAPAAEALKPPPPAPTLAQPAAPEPTSNGRARSSSAKGG